MKTINGKTTERNSELKGTQMKTKSRLSRALPLALIGLGLWALRANALNNPDTIVVSVTPGGLTYAVAISSPFVAGYQFGTVNLGATTISTVAIGVQNTGTVGEYFAMKVTNTSPDNWAPVASGPTTDQFTMIGWLAATQPAAATFLTASALSGAIPGTGNGLYGQGSRTAPTSSANLWLKLTMPSAVTGSGGAQTMTLFVNGQAN